MDLVGCDHTIIILFFVVPLPIRGQLMQSLSDEEAACLKAVREAQNQYGVRHSLDIAIIVTSHVVLTCQPECSFYFVWKNCCFSCLAAASQFVTIRYSSLNRW